MQPHGSIWRRLETALFVAAAIVACSAYLCGLIGPALGGQAPGLPGPAGFATELIAAMWMQGAVLTALVAIAALLRRRRRSGLLMTAVTLLMLAPEFVSWAGAPSLQATARRGLRIATANLAEQNLHDPGMAASLRNLDADVLVLCEYTRSWQQRLQSLQSGYAHRWLAAGPERADVQTDGLRLAVWSRLPAVAEPEVLLLDSDNAQMRLQLQFEQRVFTLFAIHPAKPYPYGVFARSFRQHAQLLDWIQGERGPTVVAGDCNASPRSAFMRRLRQLGLANVSEAVCGRAPITWPMQPTIFGVAIDHVLCSDTFTPCGFRRAPPTNSDHAAIVAELQWRSS